jgi:Fe-S-cluster containining protein
MTTECNGCGQCCEVVPMSYTKLEVAKFLRDGTIDESEARWMLEDLMPMSRREVKAVQPEFLSAKIIPPPDLVLSGEVGILPYFYTCRKWDSETRRCTDYENRPRPCHGYPWYDDETPNPAKYLPEACSFNADLGRPVKLLPTRTN